jgi:phosphoenolpyruvate carboxykinase (ATP)
MLLEDKKQRNLSMLKCHLSDNDYEILNGTHENYNNHHAILKVSKGFSEKGVDTMFRIALVNNQRISGLGDNKARILITVNSIILSAIISLVLKNLHKEEYLAYPTFILIAVSLITITLAILAIRPHVSSGRFTRTQLENNEANMFISTNPNKKPVWTIIQAPGFKANPAVHGTRQGNFTIVSFSHKTILIGGTGYTGEIKKGVFTVLNFILPYEHNVLSMHCSANEGKEGDSALFFGLSGTGKTALSSDPARNLIGDDEHGWDNNSVFNFEGGCYAKVINLSEDQEPDIYRAVRRGALVENTSFKDETYQIDFTCKKITENTRVSYPLDFISSIKRPLICGAPKNIFFLTCDAYGLFPPVSKLTDEQAMYYFINGYTSKVSGTENGIKEPQVTFSVCFGAPFLPLHPTCYAELLKAKLSDSKADVWMINTGWSGGAHGIGKRIPLKFTRAIITACLSSRLNLEHFVSEPFFNLKVPEHCDGVPSELLFPIKAWKDKIDYAVKAVELRNKFEANYKQFLT